LDERVVKEVEGKEDVLKDVVTRKVQKNKKRCWTCRKKIGFLGFKCKCEYVFCKKHRIPEEHLCVFDFKREQREKL